MEETFNIRVIYNYLHSYILNPEDLQRDIYNSAIRQKDKHFLCRRRRLLCHHHRKNSFFFVTKIFKIINTNEKEKKCFNYP